MDDLSIYNDKDNGVYLSAYGGINEFLNIGIEDPDEFVSQSFTREQVIRLRDWLNELIEETTPPPPPTNADIIEALTPGSVFTLTNGYDGISTTTWFRTRSGATSQRGTVTSNFEGWIGNHVTVEVNYIHKSEENN